MNGRSAWPLSVALLVVAVALGVWLLPALLAVVVAVAGIFAGAWLLRAPRESSGHAEEPLAASATDDLAALIEPLGEGVLLLDDELAVVAVNPAAARIVDRPMDSMVGASLIQAVRDHDLARVAREGRGERQNVHLSTAGHDVRAVALPVATANVHTMLVLEDVTELGRAQRARSELVANVSHELRTPLAAARAVAETLHEGVEEPDERQRFLDRLVEELGRLSAIVQRLLWLARLESGNEPFASEALDVTGLLDEANARMTPVAQQRGVHIETEGAAAAPPVLGDRERALEVLANLLDNAIRHSPDNGCVRLIATSEGGAVRFAVSDEGPGILPSDRERVFERFYTGDRSRMAGGGSGLGLAIARHIVQRLGGRIWVADQSGPGATLCFTLPLATEAAPQTP